MSIESEAKKVILEGLRKSVSITKIRADSSLSKLLNNKDLVDNSTRKLGYSKILNKKYTP